MVVSLTFDYLLEFSDDPTTPVIEHPNNVNFPLTSAIPPPDVSIHVSKSDSHSVKKISTISCTPVSSSKSYERNDTVLFNYDRHQQAHANRQRVKEFDRVSFFSQQCKSFTGE